MHSGHNSYISTVISVLGRESVLSRTLAQLQPLAPRVFVCDSLPPGKANHLANTQAALQWFLEQEAPHLLFLEDDLDIHASFLEAVEAACASSAIVALYAAGLSFYPAEVRQQIQAGQQCRPGLYPVVNRRRWFGSQALVLPRPAVEALVAQPSDDYFDIRIAKLTDWPLAVYVPNPVQHYGAALGSTWSKYGKPHTSRSYRL